MPFVLAYLVVSYLQGGIGVGSSGLLSNLRQYLWVPIFQTAYRCATLTGQQTAGLQQRWQGPCTRLGALQLPASTESDLSA